MPKLEKKKELQKLIAVGKEKGFLTYEEINEALPEEVVESDELDEVMTLIEDNDIEIVESEKHLKGGAAGAKKSPGRNQSGGCSGRSRRRRSLSAGIRSGSFVPEKDGLRRFVDS